MHNMERARLSTTLLSLAALLFCCFTHTGLGNGSDLQNCASSAAVGAEVGHCSELLGAGPPELDIGVAGAAGDDVLRLRPQVYFVYVREQATNQTTASHLRLLSKALGSANKAQESLIYSYKHALNGFAAMLREDHVKTLAAMHEVARIVLSRTLQPFTTNSWNFLGLPTADATDIGIMNPSIIGVIDSGVWPHLPSFKDDGIGQIPQKWNGVCNGGTGFSTSYCNRKLIGVRFYNAGWRAAYGRLPTEPVDAFDMSSHGTHVASTAGGHIVTGVSALNGLINGTARGGNHMGRLAVYKVTWEGTMIDVDVLAAMDDAIADGVDIINLSLGWPQEADYLQNPIAIASFRAMQASILTVCAAGNNGPTPSTIVNTAPWILTVAATTTNRVVVTPITLGNQALLPGFSIFLANMINPWYDLVSGENIPAVYSLAGIDNARHCRLGSLDAAKAFGRIVLCNQAPRGFLNEPSINQKCSYAMQLNAAGVIMVYDAQLYSNDNVWPPFFPCSVVSSSVGLQISNYITSTSQPTARILQTEVVFNELPAPAVAGFSSRGPNNITKSLLKPDIAAPGVDILAGYSPLANNNLYTEYGLMSGTSMAAPHVSGAASLVRAYNGFTSIWSPAAIKSALMTTAIPVTTQTDAGTQAIPLDYGSGCLQPLRAVNQPGPGLIYNAGVQEYVRFLCNMGYSESQINSIYLRPPLVADCRGEGDDPDLISQLNLPSIAILELRGTQVNIQRTVTNVGTAQSAYSPTIVQPPGVVVTVSPTLLQFSTSTTRLTYTLHLVRSSSWPIGSSVFGSITWSDGIHQVYSPIAIYSISNTT